MFPRWTLHTMKPLNHTSKGNVLEITMDIQYYHKKKKIIVN